MTATTAIVKISRINGLELMVVPMTSVHAARVGIGPTLADAKAFVLDTACTGCGETSDDNQVCADCGEPTCGCIADPHDPDTRFCPDCRDRIVCCCTECEPDEDRDY